MILTSLFVLLMLSVKSSNELHYQLKSYHQTSNISRTLVGNRIVDHSYVVGASLEHRLSAVLRMHRHSRLHTTSIDCSKTTARRDEKHLSLGFFVPYIRDLTVPLHI